MTAKSEPTSESKSSSPGAKHKILIVDDHPVFRHGIATLIDDEEQLEVCGQASDSKSALDAMRRLDPDGALLDISLPGSNGIELLKMMKAEKPDIKVLVVSMHDESLYALRSLRAGALGYVMKAEALSRVVVGLKKVLADELFISPRFSERLIFKAIRSDNDGTDSPVDHLSDRELEVLELLGKGYGTRQIAGELNLSVKTIETHRAHIKEKLDFADSDAMVRFAVEWVAREEG